jgi:hypothetical protein
MGKRRSLNIDPNYYHTIDSHIKVERGFLQHIVDILEGKKEDQKFILIDQLKNLIHKNQSKIKLKPENRTIIKPLFGS